MVWRVRLADKVLPQHSCNFQKITRIRTQKQQAMNLLLLREIEKKHGTWRLEPSPNQAWMNSVLMIKFFFQCFSESITAFLKAVYFFSGTGSTVPSVSVT